MPTFGDKSKSKILTLDPCLRPILHRAIEVYNFTVLQGVRIKEEQDKYFQTGKSKLQWPNSKHNLKPDRNPQFSLAMDLAPWPIDWGPTKPRSQWTNLDWQHHIEAVSRFYHLSGIIMAIANETGVSLRWGGDWNRNKDFTDETFIDLVHYELDWK